jgi:hypothetical protein
MKQTANEVRAWAWRFVPPRGDPEHDPRHDISTSYEDGQLGKVFIILVGGLEWALFFDREISARTIGNAAFRGRWIERIERLPYDEFRLFNYPEKWLPQVRR